jgi:ABC-type uncharacterized transport system auxiliary subunit
MKTALWLLMVVAISGCGVTVGPSGERPTIRYYHLTLDPPPPAAEKLGASIAIRSFAQDTALDREGIRYRKSDVEGGYFSNTRWAEPVASMLRSAMQADLSRSGLFDRVLLLDDSGYADATVVGEVSRFGEEDRDGRWYAVVEVTFDLVSRAEARGTQVLSEVLMSRRYHAEEPCTKNEVPEVVRALSRALSRVLAEFRGDLVAALTEGDR